MKGQLGQHFVAIADFSKAIELKPDYAIAYYNRGLAKRRLKQYADAIKDYSKATEINPDFVEAYYNRGIAKYYLGRTLEAKRDFQTALRLVRQAKDKDFEARILAKIQSLGLN